MPKLRKRFASSADQSDFSIQQIGQFWSLFGQDFNACARLNGFTKLLNVEFVGEQLFLMLQESQAFGAATPRTEMSITILDAKKGNYYYLITDRAPGQPLKESSGSDLDEGDLLAHRYPKENRTLIKLLEQCKAEIMQSISWQQREAYESYGYSGDDDDFEGSDRTPEVMSPVLH